MIALPADAAHVPSPATLTGPTGPRINTEDASLPPTSYTLSRLSEPTDTSCRPSAVNASPVVGPRWAVCDLTVRSSNRSR